MKFRMFALAAFAAALVPTIALVATPGKALAHGDLEVEGYSLVIGFRDEPAYAGMPNGLELIVTNHETEEPVTGLEQTLRVEIIYGSDKKELVLEPEFGEEGAYTADVIPSRAGDYTWHIWGEIEGHRIDVSMTSSPDTFASVLEPEEDAFPPVGAQGSGGGMDTTLIIAVAGLVAGLAGLITGVMALRRK
jgi:hypothetical protein